MNGNMLPALIGAGIVVWLLSRKPPPVQRDIDPLEKQRQPVPPSEPPVDELDILALGVPTEAEPWTPGPPRPAIRGGVPGTAPYVGTTVSADPRRRQDTTPSSGTELDDTELDDDIRMTLGIL